MSSIPSNLMRVPNLLVSGLSLGNLSRTNVALLRVQTQIASGLALTRPSDDIVKAGAIGVLDDRLERTAQVKRNLSHADAALGVLDNLLSEANDLGLSGKSIASQQINVGSSAEERRAQANVVDEMLRGLLNTANRESVAGYALGGSRPTRAPFESFLGGYRYVGDGPGLTTDLGAFSDVPLTLGAGNALAGVSARVRSGVDFNPVLTSDTRLADLAGGRGLGVSLGTISMSFDGGPSVNIDLAGADSVGDVTTRLTSAIRQYETDQGVTILGPGGVSTTGGAIRIDVAGGSPNPALQFTDLTGGHVAEDLGLASPSGQVFDAATSAGADLGPKLTWRTPVAALAGVTGSLGTIQISNAGRTTLVDLSAAATVGDVRNAIEGAGLGVRVKINNGGTGIDVLSDVAAGSAGALQISEGPGGTLTASRLGIRTFDLNTSARDFNFGKGVSVVDGRLDPTTNTATRALNVDFAITLGDGAATEIEIDLRPQDMTNVQTVLARINSEIASGLAAAGLPATALSAGISTTGDGFVFTQDPSYGSAMTVNAKNNSQAAAQLGLMDGRYDPASASLIGTDRTKVRVDSLFSHLIDLSVALRANDTSGIGLAGEDIGRSVQSLVETRGLVGAYGQRVDAMTIRETDRATVDEKTRSDLRDTDYTTAATRLALLQTQLQAGLQVAALSQGRSLLDFLG